MNSQCGPTKVSGRFAAIVSAVLFIVALCSVNVAYAQIPFLFPSTTKLTLTNATSTNATKPTLTNATSTNATKPTLTNATSTNATKPTLTNATSTKAMMGANITGSIPIGPTMVKAVASQVHVSLAN